MQPIISFFSGCGGLDSGFEIGGFQPLLAYDLSPIAVSTYNYNRPCKVARVSDLATIDVKTIVAHINERGDNNAPIGIIGGPPCQTFSNSNQHLKENDIRRTLPARFAQLLKGLNAHFQLKFFVFENVEGITFKRHVDEFAQFRTLFEDAGFKLHEKLLNAVDYGVPQSRPRVFIVGINQDLVNSSAYRFPQPLQQPQITVYQAFEKVFGCPPWPEAQFFQRDLRQDDIPFHPNHWTMVPRSPKFSEDDALKRHIGRSFRTLSWDKPSWTVAYGNREIHIHPDGKRRLSIFEAMILQGFSKDYVLLGNLSQQVKQVSDAVPPPLAHQLALSISSFLEGNS